MTAEKRAGKAVDTDGGPVVDPTRNVLDLVEAAVKRADDLRAADRAFYEARIGHAEYVSELRASHATEISGIRAGYETRLSEAEADRLNSIRLVDSATAAAQAATLAQSLQMQAAANERTAETLRNTVLNTATVQEQKASGVTAALSERLTAVEREGHQGRGKAGVTDPMLAEKMADQAAEIRALRTAQAMGAGKSAGLSAGWAILLGVVVAAVAIYGALRPH